MSASDHLNPAQFYHGTDAHLSPGDLVMPGYGPGREHTADRKREYAYMVAAVPHVASQFGAHVYEVQPTGRVGNDPEAMVDGENTKDSYRSRKPLRVLGEHDFSA